MLVRTTLGSLECRVFDPAGPEAAPTLIVVMCHGFGVPGDDLVPLSRELVSLAPAFASKATLDGSSLVSRFEALSGRIKALAPLCCPPAATPGTAATRKSNRRR